MDVVGRSHILTTQAFSGGCLSALWDGSCHHLVTKQRGTKLARDDSLYSGPRSHSPSCPPHSTLEQVSNPALTQGRRVSLPFPRKGHQRICRCFQIALPPSHTSLSPRTPLCTQSALRFADHSIWVLPQGFTVCITHEHDRPQPAWEGRLPAEFLG